jgi:hypothetical protein
MINLSGLNQLELCDDFHSNNVLIVSLYHEFNMFSFERYRNILVNCGEHSIYRPLQYLEIDVKTTWNLAHNNGYCLWRMDFQLP